MPYSLLFVYAFFFAIPYQDGWRGTIGIGRGGGGGDKKKEKLMEGQA